MKAAINKSIGLAVLAVLLTFNVLAKKADRDSIAAKKADFLLTVANSIRYPDLVRVEHYKIGIYGRGLDVKALVKELESRVQDHLVQGKSMRLVEMELHHFKRAGQIEPVDLIYVSGKSRIRMNDLNARLEGRPYIIVTENFPFGLSSLNFSVNEESEVLFEMNPEAYLKRGAEVAEQLQNSPNRITSEKEWNDRLGLAFQLIAAQNTTIEEQKAEISGREQTIKQQRYIILISIVSVLAIGLLVIVLVKSERKKKTALKQVWDSINYAERIQTALLPTNDFIKNCLPENFVMYWPKDVVSGDFYWVENANDKVFFSVADCTGHGVPGALMSLICSNALTKCVKELGLHEPAEILERSDELLESHFSKGEKDVLDGMDLALCCLEPKTGMLTYAGANNPLYIIRNGDFIELKPDRQPIGKYLYKKPFASKNITVKKGDCIYLFSDGIVDQFGGPGNKKFKRTPFRELLMEIHGKPMDVQKLEIENVIGRWKNGGVQTDDICVMGIRI